MKTDLRQIGNVFFAGFVIQKCPVLVFEKRGVIFLVITTAAKASGRGNAIGSRFDKPSHDKAFGLVIEEFSVLQYLPGVVPEPGIKNDKADDENRYCDYL